MYLVSISRVGIKIFWPVVKGTENGKNNNENLHNVHIILLSYVYAWLKYARLNRKDRLKDMRGTTFEVAMLADVSESHSLPISTFK